MTRFVVITGATRGLGRAMTHGLIERGHTVAGCGRSAVAVDELGARYTAPNRFNLVNVADDAAVARWAAQIIDTLGPPDLLLNNAAIINQNAPLWEVPLAEFDRVIDINIKGVANVLRHFVPAMAARGKGVVVNFSSGWGRSTSPHVAPYCASKWAVEGMTRALAQELPEGMAAISLDPGLIDTFMLRTTFDNDAGSYPNPERWAQTAIPQLLALNSQDNGAPLTLAAV
jgi:NAD(P)-dependent dehydrogenase (short-subunit alcohol dehydrogenase family)